MNFSRKQEEERQRKLLEQFWANYEALRKVKNVDALVEALMIYVEKL